MFQGALCSHDIAVISAAVEAPDMHYETESSASSLWLTLDEQSLFATLTLFK